jgi:hypothetical protein
MADVPFGQYTLTLSLFRAREQLPQQEFSFPERSHRSRGIWCGVAFIGQAAPNTTPPTKIPPQESGWRTCPLGNTPTP